jgi:predicted nucleic acid-binding Zn finger protein
MSKHQTKELELLDRICSQISKTGKPPRQLNLKAYPTFQKRYEKAVKIAEDALVSRYTFLPSGRVVWTVKGRSGEYQVIPQTNFCSCDDFYFRVMGDKRQVCYHLMAQKIAHSLRLYNDSKLKDRDYDRITEKWRVKESTQT